jgi:hypothetical protein
MEVGKNGEVALNTVKPQQSAVTTKITSFWLYSRVEWYEFTSVSDVLTASIIRVVIAMMMMESISLHGSTTKNSTRLHGSTTKKITIYVHPAVTTSNPTAETIPRYQ